MPTTRHLNYAKTRFILSAPDISHLPSDAGIEVAFVGRSNAGKSSALNALAQQKHLARISKTPGRTQLINLFEIEPNCRIVDLPGYGYAKVPTTMKRTWQQLLNEYLQKRKSLGGMVILMDIRHPLKDLDQKMIDWSVAVGLPVMLLLTKADKLARGAQKKQLHMIREAILPFQGDIAVEIFSSLKKIGFSSLTAKLDEWYSAMTLAKTGCKNKK